MESQQEEQYSSGELFKPIADEEINQKYFASSREAKVSYYAPNGGNITSQDGNLITAAEYMTAKNAAALYQKSHSGGVNDLIIGLKWTGTGAIISTVISKWSDYAFMSDSFSTGKNIAHQVY